jgi:chromosomal replication initiator protein
VGTGKTHLIEGIYIGLRRMRPDWRIVFVGAEEFTNRFVQAMRFGKLAGFRHHFRAVDALLLDDLQFLATKRATKEEFLHTFDAILGSGGQLVCTADCHPRLTDELGPELIDRLLGGAAWGLTTPDAATRREILRAKTLRLGLSLEEPILEVVSERLTGNVRELEGAAHSLQHMARVTGRAIDMDLTRQVLGDFMHHIVRTHTLEDVEGAVNRALRLEDALLRSKKRCWAATHPRMLAMYLARKHTAATYGEIGQHFGGRNHSTAVAAEKKVRQWLKEDGDLIIGEMRWRTQQFVEKVERELNR